MSDAKKESEQLVRSLSVKSNLRDYVNYLVTVNLPTAFT